MNSGHHEAPGERFPVCAGCGGRVIVSTVAGTPPVICHEADCRRTSWPVMHAVAYEDGVMATITNWPKRIDHEKGKNIVEVDGAFNPGQVTVAKMRSEVGYSPDEDGSVDELIAYKDACEERMIQAIDEAAKYRSALETIAKGVPVKDDWESAADFMKAVIAPIESAGVQRPDHYPVDWR